MITGEALLMQSSRKSSCSCAGPLVSFADHLSVNAYMHQKSPHQDFCYPNAGSLSDYTLKNRIQQRKIFSPAYTPPIHHRMTSFLFTGMYIKIKADIPSLLENQVLAIYNSTTEINLLRRFQYFFCFLRIINCTSSHQTFLCLPYCTVWKTPSFIRFLL